MLHSNSKVLDFTILKAIKINFSFLVDSYCPSYLIIHIYSYFFFNISFLKFLIILFFVFYW